MTATLQITKQKRRGELLDTSAVILRFKRVIELGLTISCLGSKRSIIEISRREPAGTTQLRPPQALSILSFFARLSRRN